MKELAKRFALMAVSVLVTVLATDQGYRWLIEPDKVVPRSLGRFDETLGWATKRNATASSSVTGSRVQYSINAKGLRDDETEYAKPSGTLRMVLLGDSYTFGYGVPIEQHFSKLLEGYFSQVEVINMGVSGYGVDQELLALRREGLRYQPDIVIAYVAHFGDQRHMYSHRFGKGKPQFLLRDGDLELTNVPVPSEQADPSEYDGSGLDLVHRVDLFLIQISPLYRDDSKAAIGLIHRAVHSAPAPVAKIAPAEDSAFVDRMYELADAILMQLDRETTAAGGHFVLVTQLPRLYHECLGLGMSTLDVSPPLQNLRFSLPNGLSHINEAGNGVLAWEIARFLTETGLIPASHRLGAGAADRPAAGSPRDPTGAARRGRVSS